MRYLKNRPKNGGSFGKNNFLFKVYLVKNSNIKKYLNEFFQLESNFSTNHRFFPYSLKHTIIKHTILIKHELSLL